MVKYRDYNSGMKVERINSLTLRRLSLSVEAGVSSHLIQGIV